MPQTVAQRRSDSIGLHRLPSFILGFWFWILASSFITGATTYFYRHILNLRHTYPFANPWFAEYSYQIDFNCFSERIKHFHEESFFHQPSMMFNYPALLALVYKFFYLFGVHAHTLFITTLVSSFLIATLLFTRTLHGRGVALATACLLTATVLLTSHPLALLLYLANMEGIVWIFTALGMFAYATHRPWTAAVCFGIAGAMKIVPLIYLGLLLQRKQYRAFVAGLVVFLLLNIISLQVLGPTIRIASSGLAEGIRTFRDVYIYQFHELESSVDHSLYALFKVGFVVTNRLDLLRLFATSYLIVCAVGGLILYITHLRFLPPINLALALTVAAVLLPQVSHDYTLVHLYAPWAMLVLFSLDEELKPDTSMGLRIAMACFVILFTSENYLIINGVRFAGQIKALALIVLMFVAIHYPFESTRFNSGVCRDIRRD